MSRRTAMAEQKMAQAERDAVSEVRQRNRACRRSRPQGAGRQGRCEPTLICSGSLLRAVAQLTGSFLAERIESRRGDPALFHASMGARVAGALH